MLSVRTRLRRLVPVLPLALLVVLAACGTDADDPGTAPDPADEEPEAEEPEAEEPEADGFADLDPVRWTLYHGAAEDTPYDVASTHLSDAVEEATGGQFSIEVICCASLGDEVTTMDLYATGDIDMGLHFSSSAGTVIREYSFLGMPFLFDDDDHWWEVMSDPEMLDYWQNITESYGVDFRIGTYGTFGVRNVYTVDRVLETLDDFRGLKIRLPESPILSRIWSAVGVDPVVLPFPDVYSGLQSGVVEAAENCPWCMLAVAHHEVAREYNYTRHETGHTFVFVRSAAYDDLDPAYQQVLDDALVEMQRVWFEDQKRQNEEAEARFDELGVTPHELPDETLQQIREIVTPHQQEFAADFGVEDFLQQVEDAR